MIVDIRSIEHINNEEFGKCLLVKTFPIVDSPFGWGGCVDMSRTISLLYPDNSKMLTYLNEAKNNDKEYFEFAENGAFSYRSVPGVGTCYIHNSFFEDNSFSESHGNSVDLGLSVLWADCNVGASSPSEYGKLFGYGDTSGDKWTEDESAYPKVAICNTEYDIAKANWGDGWRMPTSAELEELSKKCRWEQTCLNGVNGNRVTGSNGNSIFLPYAGSRIGVSTFRQGQLGQIWSGSLSKFGSAVDMMFFGYSATLNYGANAAWGSSVRPVKDK